MNTPNSNYLSDPTPPSPAWEFDPATEIRTIPGGWEMGDVLKPPSITGSNTTEAAAFSALDMESFLEPRTIPTGWDLSDKLGDIMVQAKEPAPAAAPLSEGDSAPAHNDLDENED
jgi:hypothetical protein